MLERNRLTFNSMYQSQCKNVYLISMIVIVIVNNSILLGMLRTQVYLLNQKTHTHHHKLTFY